MKTTVIIILLLLLGIFSCLGQGKINPPPIIDMHLHVYTPKNYWGGSAFKAVGAILQSPADSKAHLNAVIQQIKKYNIVKTYASGNFEALDIINSSYPDLFLPSIEISPTEELLGNKDFLNAIEQRIKSGEIQAIGEVLNFYNGIAPNDPVMDTLYKLAIKYDLPIGLHFAPGPPGSQFTYNPNMRLEYSNPFLVQDVLIKFPKLRLYIMHAGLPMFMEETLAMLMMYPDLYVDISCLPWYNTHGKCTLDDFLKKAFQYGYGDRIMFGSDEMTWPGAIGLTIDYINNLEFLSESQKRDLLYNNAVKFLRLSEQEDKYPHLVNK